MNRPLPMMLMLLVATPAVAQGTSRDTLTAAHAEAGRLIERCRSGEAACGDEPLRTELGRAFLVLGTWSQVVEGQPDHEANATARYLAPSLLADWSEVLPPAVEAWPVAWVYSLDAPAEAEATPRPAEPELPLAPAETQATAAASRREPVGARLLLRGGVGLVPRSGVSGLPEQPVDRSPGTRPDLTLRGRGRVLDRLFVEGQLSYGQDSQPASPALLSLAGEEGYLEYVASGPSRLVTHEVEGHLGLGVSPPPVRRARGDVFGVVSLRTGSFTPANVSRLVEQAGVTPNPGTWGVGGGVGARLVAELGGQADVRLRLGSVGRYVKNVRLGRGTISSVAPIPDATDRDADAADRVLLQGEVAVELRLRGPVFLGVGIDGELAWSENSAVLRELGEPGWNGTPLGAVGPTLHLAVEI